MHPYEGYQELKVVLAPPKPKPIEPCEICGHTFQERSCKVICPNCGFTRDCSDPYKQD